MCAEKFVTAITCIDGRIQLPVINWMKQTYRADYVDMITEPGVDRLLASGDPQALASLKAKVLISVKGHGSAVVAVVGHVDCLGNPVSDEQHIRDIKASVSEISKWDLNIALLIGLWVGRKWKPQIIEA